MGQTISALLRQFATFFQTKYSLKIFLLLGVLLLVLGCSEDSSTNPSGTSDNSTPHIKNSDTPELWVINSTRFHNLRVSLEVPEFMRDAILSGDAAPPNAVAQISELTGMADFQPIYIPLRDDGNQTTYNDLAPYISPLSGDLISKDFTWSAKINSRFTEVEGEYVVTYAIGNLAARAFEAGILPDEAPSSFNFFLETSDTLNIGIIDITPTTLEVKTPDFWQYNSDFFRTIEATITLPSYVKNFITSGEILAPRISATFYNPNDPAGSSYIVELLDEGGDSTRTNPPQYLAERSGDVLSGDFTYTAQVNSLFASDEMEYFVVYAAGDLTDTDYEPPEDLLENTPTNNFKTAQDTITVLANNPPSIVEFEFPDSLKSAFEVMNWRVVLADSDLPIGDYIDFVKLSFMLDSVVEKEVEFEKISDEEWEFTAQSSFSAGLLTGDYDLELVASDRFNATDTLRTSVWLENSAPVILTLTAPDTVVRPLEGENVYYFFCDIDDGQGLEDISRVEYLVRSPQSDQFVSNVDWELKDDGEDPDQRSGDGVFSAGFLTRPENSNFGPYVFRFIGTDSAGYISEPYDKIIEFVENPGR
ncbi:hypothetical protein K8I28_13605 [bacterium]|nr:hypothetical protein [bacterium]